ncbi:MAG: outer membrane protein assembly factor BamC, partial [Gammaproteobacteria bacterium]|nr:outer membrane protein assembly factor BamC [Gammaproteobacteria bacterium]
LLAYLGLEPEQAKALVKGADENLVSLDFDSTPYALVVKDSRERVNRSVKLALDRSGYEIENEDSARSQLTVKLKAETTENQFVPGFALSKASQTRFFIQIKGKDNSVRVEVVSPDGGADTSDAAKNLLRDLKDRI